MVNHTFLMSKYIINYRIYVWFTMFESHWKSLIFKKSNSAVCLHFDNFIYIFAILNFRAKILIFPEK